MNLCHNSKGFTLIELIVVIIILGILATVAIPKYVDMKQKAYVANAKSIAAAYKEAAVSVRMKAKVLDSPSTVTISGRTINVSPDGWPWQVGSSNNNQGCIALWNNLLDSPPPVESLLGIYPSLGQDWSVVYYNRGCHYFYGHGETASSTTPIPQFHYRTSTSSVGEAGTITTYDMD